MSHRDPSAAEPDKTAGRVTFVGYLGILVGLFFMSFCQLRSTWARARRRADRPDRFRRRPWIHDRELSLAAALILLAPPDAQ
jgi:hypothetical protein